MCGIAGWFMPAARIADAHGRLARMRRALAHRGPDGDGELVLAHAGLAHTRLAIIDLGGGRQPMQSADGRYSISFNGEIYNYRTLRGALEAGGAAFRTDSDTEVVLNLVAAEGVGALGRLRGMYAFALWDAREGRGWLVRDPLGIKPLFWSAAADGGLWFASEAKALAAAGLAAELDPAALHLVMNFRYLPGNASLLRGVQQLAPGAVLGWERSGRRREQRHAPAPGGAAADADLLAALRESVRAHLTADVEVGTYLSGGLDSAAVTALAKGEYPRPLRSFTAAVGDDPNEAANAGRSAELLGVANLQARCDAGAASPAHMIWHTELPKVNALQVGLVAGHAAQHVKVVLSGLGGDELFLGYNVHRWLWRLHAAGRLPGRLRRAVAAPAAAGLRLTGAPPFGEPERALGAFAAAGDWPRVYALLRNVWDGTLAREAVYGPRLLEARLPDAVTELRAHWPAVADPVAACAGYEWRQKMVNDLLWQEDRMSMAHSLEVRVPFVDVELAGRVQALPVAELMPGGRPKGLMQSLLAPLLPAEIGARPKSGFQVEAPSFVGGVLGPWLDVFLSRERVLRHGLFNPAFVQRVLAAPPRKAWRWHWFMLYLMLGAHLWLELFEQGRSVADLDAEVAAA